MGTKHIASRSLHTEPHFNYKLKCRLGYKCSSGMILIEALPVFWQPLSTVETVQGLLTCHSIPSRIRLNCHLVTSSCTEQHEFMQLNHSISWVRSVTLKSKIKFWNSARTLKNFKLHLYGEKKINEHLTFSYINMALYNIGQNGEFSKGGSQIRQSMICI